jgi:hypothetical protein
VAAKGLAEAFYEKGKVVLIEPLGRTVQFGAVGYFSAGQWVGVSSTTDMFSLTLAKSPGSGQPNSFDAKGGNGFSFQVKAAGTVSQLIPDVADARLRAEVSFGSKDGFVMSVRDQKVKAAKDLAELMGAIRWAYHYRKRLPEGRRWNKKYSVIVGVAGAASVVAVVATSSNAAIVVEGSAKLSVPTDPAKLDAKMTMTKSTESIEKLWQGPITGYAVMALRLDPSVWKQWDDEDFKYQIGVAGAAGVAAAPPPRSTRSQRLTRPRSFVAWANQEGLANPAKAKVYLLAPAGRPGKTGTVLKLVGSAKRPAASKINVTTRPPSTGRTAKKSNRTRASRGA